jgi:HlyD family secretion protein
LFLGLLFTLAACQRRDPHSFQGYIEGEYLHLGAPVPGLLLDLKVARGDTVKAGDRLFVLESDAEKAAVIEAQRRLVETQARYDNLLKGRRPTELAALEARMEQNSANLEFWNTEFARREQLFRGQVISSTELDQARRERDAARAALDSATAELATARLGGREDEVRAADAERAAAEASVERARWTLEQKTQHAPMSGIVHDTLYRPGEFVSVGAPVVSLLPPENIKVRFFVSQGVLSRITSGAPVHVYRDGTSEPVGAHVSYIATQPEFTPPVIYSRETRAKLVFMVEARFASTNTARLHPGQPVDVRLGSTSTP